MMAAFQEQRAAPRYLRWVASRYPWSPGSATGPGPFPGTDPVEASRAVLDALPQFAHLPVLPARGPGAGLVGHTAALLVDLHVELQPAGWRLVPRPGRDEQRARSMLATVLDAVQEAAEGYDGPFKLQLLGPWTLAAAVELARGEKALADEGAVRDLAGSLAEGLARHLTEMRARLPSVERFVVELAEPLLGAAIQGQLRTASGWGRLPPVDEAACEQVLGQVLVAGGRDAGVRLAGAGSFGALACRAGARFLGMDAETLGSADWNDLGEALEQGTGLLLGLVPVEAGRNDGADLRPIAQPVWQLWRQLGLSLEVLPQAVVITPADGLERLEVSEAKAVLQRAVKLGRYLEEAVAEDAP